MAKQSSGFAAADDIALEIDADSIPVISLEALKIDKIEARELGCKLPIGIFLETHEGLERLQDYTLVPYKTKYDRVLGQLLSAPKAKLATVLGAFLPQMIESIGGYTVKEVAQKMNVSTQRLIEGMYLADALAIVLSIRLASQGGDISMSAQCPNCGTQNEDDPKKGRPFHDLNSVEVGVVRDLRHKIRVEVNLSDGIQIIDDVAKKIHMQPLRLFQVDQIAKPGSGIPVDIALLYAMVCGLPEATTLGNLEDQRKMGQIFSDEFYDELTRDDLKTIRKAIEVLQPGPEMNADMNCSACGHEWEAAVPWPQLRSFLFTSADTNGGGDS